MNIRGCKWNLLTLATGLLLACEGLSQEGRIIGLNGDVHSVNLTKGTTNLIGWTGHHDHFWGTMAMDSQGQLFSATGDWIDKFSIYEIDPDTGSATFVVDTQLTEIGAMAFDDNDNLYLAHDPSWPTSGGIYELHTVDLISGATTLIGVSGTVNLLAMDFFDGEMYGNTTSHGLVKIDLATGLATDVNPEFIGPPGMTMSMCFDGDGSLHYIDGANWMLDKDSGIRHPVGWMDVFGFWGGMEFIDGPNPKISLTIVGTTKHYMGGVIRGATPNGTVAVWWSIGNSGVGTIPSGFTCSGLRMDIGPNLKFLTRAIADAGGEAILGPSPTRVPASVAGNVWLQAVDLTTCVKSNKILIYI
ncbi:MAG: hypothetical protein H8E15_07090 [Planctomycetes bacterium]|nr:hypothetical protein [Planctomycetota bacterium]